MRHGWKRLLPALLALLTLAVALPVTGFAQGGAVVTEGTDLLDGQPLIVPMAVGMTYNAVNYFDVNFTSTNGHYTGEGIFVDTGNAVHLVLRLNANSNYQPIESVSVTAGGATYPGSVEYITADPGNGDEITVYLPGGAQKSITAQFRLFVLKLGPLDDLGDDFWIRVKMAQGDGGWGIHGEEVTVDTTDYTIEKTVDRAAATIGDVLEYTITVRNTGTLPLSGILVTDAVPAGLTAAEMSADGGGSWTPVSAAGGIVTLGANVSLAAGTSKTYLLRAAVNETAQPGTATNEATMGGAVVEKDAQADTDISARDVVITKLVTGNIGDRTSEFPFEAWVEKGGANLAIAPGTGYSQDPATKRIAFALSHNGSVTLINLPTDGTLKIKETDAKGHAVSVSVGGTALGDTDGVYGIALDALSSGIVVTNTKNVVIDTGIRLDALPYIAILALVAVVAAIWLIRRRRHRKDD